MIRTELSPTQEWVYRYVHQYIETQQRPPTVSEISAARGVTNHATWLVLKVLSRKGWIDITPHIARGISLAR